MNDDDERNATPKSSVLPATKPARQQVFNLLFRSSVLELSGQEHMTTDYLWDNITPEMCEGRVKAQVADAGSMNKAAEALSGLWNMNSKSRDSHVEVQTMLPEAESDDEEDDAGDGAEEDDSDESGDPRISWQSSWPSRKGHAFSEAAGLYWKGCGR